jgi:AcrR family transcriptional regulator
MASAENRNAGRRAVTDRSAFKSASAAGGGRAADRNEGSARERSPGRSQAAQPPAKGKGPSRHYRRAQRDRGAETRARLIEAALDVFGRLGFEGATTRLIAKEAGANLAAIVYHFGSKEALYRAVAEHIVARIGALIGPALATMGSPEAVASPAAARAALCKVLATHVDVMLGTAEAERWARFIVREQMQPTSAFDLIYGFMGGSHALATKLVSVALQRPEDEEVKLRVFTLIGQVLVFRVAQTLVLKRMGWQGIGDAERARIKRIIVANVDAILDHEPNA